MNFKRVATSEKEFKETGRAVNRSFALKSFSIDIPGDENLQLEGYTCRPANGYSGYYEAERNEKQNVVLHFTAGHLQSDIYVLTRPKAGHLKWRLSTNFVVGRDGTIYQLFSSAYWSHHLGPQAIGGNQEGSKKSIAIEISNYGPLTKVGENMETIYSRTRRHPNRVDVYCTIHDKEQYVELDKPFRGHKYFAAYTNEQYESIILLLRYLTATYKIPRRFLPENERFEASFEGASFRGINSHVNYRSSGKWDIGPSFDWDRVIAGVQAEQYGIEDENTAKVLAAQRALQSAKEELAEIREVKEECNRQMDLARIELEKNIAAMEASQRTLTNQKQHCDLISKQLTEAEANVESAEQALAAAVQNHPDEMDFITPVDVNADFRSEDEIETSMRTVTEEDAELDYDPTDWE